MPQKHSTPCPREGAAAPLPPESSSSQSRPRRPRCPPCLPCCSSPLCCSLGSLLICQRSSACKQSQLLRASVSSATPFVRTTCGAPAQSFLAFPCSTCTQTCRHSANVPLSSLGHGRFASGEQRAPKASCAFLASHRAAEHIPSLGASLCLPDKCSLHVAYACLPAHSPSGTCSILLIAT